MLRDRKELLEHEIKRLHSEASNMYLSLVVGQTGDITNPSYQTLKEKISDMTFELKLVTNLITEGHR
jgi:hypothetical protein